MFACQSYYHGWTNLNDTLNTEMFFVIPAHLCFEKHVKLSVLGLAVVHDSFKAA